MENMLIVNFLVFVIVALLVASGFLLYSFFKARRKEKQRSPAVVLFEGKAPPIPKAEATDFLPVAEPTVAESAVPTAHGSVEIRAPRPKPSRRVRLAAADAHIFPPSGDDSPSSEDGSDASLDFSIDVEEPLEEKIAAASPSKPSSNKTETEVLPIGLAKSGGSIPSAMIFRKRKGETTQEPKHELADGVILLVKTGRYMLSFADENFAETNPVLYGILKTSGETSFCHLSERPPQYLPIKKGDITRTSGSYVARVPKDGDTFTDMKAPTAEQLQAMGVGLARSPRNPESRGS